MCFGHVETARLILLNRSCLVAYYIFSNLNSYLLFVTGINFFLLFQYSPQLWLNFKRKSTTGFHIGGVLLDFGGGVLSLLQMDIYCFIEHSNQQLTGNTPKMALALATLFFNIILIWQHYVFYLGNDHSDDEEQPLLKGPKKTKFYSVNVNAEDGGFQLTSLSISEDESIKTPRRNKVTRSQESLV